MKFLTISLLWQPLELIGTEIDMVLIQNLSGFQHCENICMARMSNSYVNPTKRAGTTSARAKLAPARFAGYACCYHETYVD